MPRGVPVTNRDLLLLQTTDTLIDLPWFESHAAMIRHLWTFIPWLTVKRGPLTEELFSPESLPSGGPTA